METHASRNRMAKERRKIMDVYFRTSKGWQRQYFYSRSQLCHWLAGIHGFPIGLIIGAEENES
jgi:hypothetical protein